jgi:hypothetical protein
MFYLPPGSMMQLMDGRILHKDQKTNLWHDNLGVPITEQQLQFMMSFPSFSDDPSGGGDSPNTSSTPAEQTSLSAPFDDIVIVTEETDTFNANRTLVITGDPATLRITFASVGTYGNATFKAYKNDVQINQIRVSVISAGLVTTLSETFANGDQLKFSGFVPTQYSSLMNFDVTLEKTAPGSTDVLDVFNVSFTP